MIIWLNGPFGAGKTATTREIAKLLPAIATFDPEEVGLMLKHALGADFPGGDFQNLPTWRRLTVAALADLTDYLGKDILVPQSVLVESHWDHIRHGLRDAGVELAPFTLHVETEELTQRIATDTVLENAAEWRLEHRAIYRSALPWLKAKTTVIDTTSLTPTETAHRVIGTLSTHDPSHD